MFTKWLNALSECTLFQGIEPIELNVMLECLKPKVSSYEKNEHLTLAGEKFNGIGIVFSGEVAVIKESAAGNRVLMTLLKSGELFGEMAAFSGNGTWPATVVAQGDCTVMTIPPEKIVGNCERGCTGHRQLINNMLKIISQRALLLNRKVEYLTIKSIRGKISTYLLEQYHRTKSTMFMLPLNRTELADFLNVTRPSLSREMCRMRDEGIIEFHRASIRIKDLNSLKKTAG